jgi:phage shock protein PspC (stress-responsive transcriptional regulator)
MTTTNEIPPPPPPGGGHTGGTYPAPPPVPPAGRQLRRSMHDRVAGGVAGGLGEYFGVDPVLFRVLFAATAFFGGAGVVAYLIAWVAIPEAGTPASPLDRFAGQLRRRHVPLWVIIPVGVILGWSLLFSWWRPWPLAPVVVAVVILTVVLSRRPGRPGGGSPGGGSPGGAVNLSKAAGTDPGGAGLGEAIGYPVAGQQPWLPETRAWLTEARERRRIRRARARPVRWATLGVLVLTLAVLGLADWTGGIVLPAYFWVAGGIVVLGLTAGLALRRTPWSLATLLVPVLLGLIAFGGTHASLHDGAGQQLWAPADADQLSSQYRLAFGQGVLDLSQLGALAGPLHTSVTVGAGQVKIIVPASANIVIDAHVHLGTVRVDGNPPQSGGRSAGVDVQQLVSPGAGASGPTLTVDVQLADGLVSIQR